MSERVIDLPAGKLPWLVTTLVGGIIAFAGFMARAEFSRLTSEVEKGNRALAELRLELVGVQAAIRRNDEISMETRLALRELEARVRKLEEGARAPR